MNTRYVLRPALLAVLAVCLLCLAPARANVYTFEQDYMLDEYYPSYPYSDTKNCYGYAMSDIVPLSSFHSIVYDTMYIEDHGNGTLTFRIAQPYDDYLSTGLGVWYGTSASSLTRCAPAVTRCFGNPSIRVRDPISDELVTVFQYSVWEATVTGLQPGRTYYFKTHAVYTLTTGEYYLGPTISYTPGTSPQVADFSAKNRRPAITNTENVGDGSVILDWTAPTRANAYIVMEVRGGQASFCTATTSQYTLIPSLTEGAHTFEIRPVFDPAESMSTSGPASPRVTVTVKKQSSGGDNSGGSSSAEPVPTLTGKQTGEGKVELSWKVEKKYAFYSVYEIIDGKNKLLKTVSNQKLTLTGVSKQKHVYIVRPKTAKDKTARYGEFSNSVTVNLGAPASDAHDTAPTLTAKQTAPGQVKLAWTASKKYPYYSVYESLSGQNKLIKTVTGSTLTLTGVKQGSHTYLVRPKTAKDKSARYGLFSNVASVSLEDWKLTAPRLTNNGSSGSTVKLKWTVSGAAAGYHAVFEVVDGQNELVKVVSSKSVTFKDVPAGKHTYVVYPCSSKDDGRAYGKPSNKVTVTVKDTGSLRDKLTRQIGSGQKILAFSERDYDGNGVKEAFALVYTKKTSDGWVSDTELWFVSSSGARKCETPGLMVYMNSGVVTRSGRTAFTFFYSHGGSGGWHEYWTVVSGSPAKIN